MNKVFYCLIFLCLNSCNLIDEIFLPKSKVELGEKLFFDKKLSITNKISCASCHLPEYAFADTNALSKGVYGRLGQRNTPSVMNMSARSIFFYDGRARNLEHQATFPIQDHNEMSLFLDSAIANIINDEYYIKAFQNIYMEAPNKQNVLNAIAEFEKSLETSSPFDEYMAGDTNALTASQIRGHKLFIGNKTKCFDCHFSPDFTGDEFRNIGLFDGNTYNDSGRYLITKNPDDLGKFKTPGLRNVAVTFPYMHDGSFKTLRAVIEYYNDIYHVVSKPINEDSLVKKSLDLTEQEITDIENFLISLTDDKFKHLIDEKNTTHR